MKSSIARPRRHGALACVVLAAALAACGGDDPLRPPTDALCDGTSQSVLSLDRHEGRVLTGAAVHCTVLAGAGASYLVMPQLTGATLPYGGFGFRIGDPVANPTLPTVTAADAWLFDADGRSTSEAPDAQAELDRLLRRREHLTVADRPSRQGVSSLRDLVADSLRSFSVLSTLDETPEWATIGAGLRYSGARVLLYVDTAAASSLSADELAAMGALYDDVLAPRAFDAFGNGSDVDGNDRIIFLLTPVVNAMIPSAECATRGYVRGFFYSHDLASMAPTSNRGEVFYAFVPDPTGRWSCAHTKTDVLSNLPPTFIHELQHMISYGAHAIVNGGAGEEPWLNEGLSHVAEELGSLYWEGRFPSPSGRTNATQIFPDSAAAYINPNLLYSYRFLFNSGFYSLTSCAPGSFCSLNERGGIWMFLRWMVDQRGVTALRTLVQTPLTGRTNLEAASGRSVPQLLADFAIAVNVDSLAGVNRSTLPAPFRFVSRNFRTIYQRLYESLGIAGGVSRPYPIAPAAMDAGVSRTGTMRPGTFATYRIDTGAGTLTAALRFSVPDGSAFPASSGAQISIFRID